MSLFPLGLIIGILCNPPMQGAFTFRFELTNSINLNSQPDLIISVLKFANLCRLLPVKNIYFIVLRSTPSLVHHHPHNCFIVLDKNKVKIIQIDLTGDHVIDQIFIKDSTIFFDRSLSHLYFWYLTILISNRQFCIATFRQIDYWIKRLYTYVYINIHKF